MKKAKFRGQTLNVIDEDEKYVTLEGYGYRRRHLKEDVVIEESPEDTITSVPPEETLPQTAPEVPLQNEIPDSGFKPIEESSEKEIAMLTAKRADLAQKVAKLDEIIAKGKGELAKQVKTDVSMNPSSVAKMEETSTTPVDIKSKNDKNMKSSLHGLRKSFRLALNEIDDILEENVDEEKNGHVIADPKEESQDINYSDLDNHYGSLDIDDFNGGKATQNEEIGKDNIVKVIKWKDGTYELPTGDIERYKSHPDFDGVIEASEISGLYFEPESKKRLQVVDSTRVITEEGAGTVSVAGPGCGDATTNQAIHGNAGIAIVPSRLGMDKRKLEEEHFKLDLELQLDESVKSATLNRHVVADKIEETIDGINEQILDRVARRKARIDSIGRFVSTNECATFLAANKFSSKDLKYVPREQPLDHMKIADDMRRLNSKIISKIKKI